MKKILTILALSTALASAQYSYVTGPITNAGVAAPSFRGTLKPLGTPFGQSNVLYMGGIQKWVVVNGQFTNKLVQGLWEAKGDLETTYWWVPGDLSTNQVANVATNLFSQTYTASPLSNPISNTESNHMGSLGYGADTTNYLSDSAAHVNGITLASQFLTAPKGALLGEDVYVGSTTYGAGDVTLTSGRLEWQPYDTYLTASAGTLHAGTNLAVPGAFYANMNNVTNISVPDTVQASNFVSTTWKWVDALASGVSLGSPASAASLTLVGTNLVAAMLFDDNEVGHFSIQSPHKLATTNASHPDIWVEPHIHVSATNVLADSTNLQFRLDLQIAPVNGEYVNYLNRTGYVVFDTNANVNVASHKVVSFGNITNNALSGKSSVIFRGKLTKLIMTNDVPSAFVDSTDVHLPVTELGTVGQNGD